MIIGTAGHVDHGKTALVEALTGIDADRLKEEKDRGITIDLGFAYQPLDDGSVLGFVDVPGHEKFIRNMLAGATGIDFVILVIAADDGVMPQTREHLDIVNLLDIRDGMIVLTKCDLASDERLAQVETESRTLVEGTALNGASVFRVSAKTGQGIDDLRDTLIEQAGSSTSRDVDGLFRLCVDRRFSLQGIGTVVTGAVISGSVRVGDAVMVSPAGLPARVRSIHAQNRPAEIGQAGERCALNLVGEQINLGAVSRGDFVQDAIAHGPTEAVDCELTLLASETKPLAHWTQVRLHHGANEIGARAALLQHEDIRPGGKGRIQLVLEKPVAAAIGDRFVIRDASGARTMGGGRLIDLRGPRRRRRTLQRLARIDALSLADPVDCLKALLECEPFGVDLGDFARDRAMSDGQLWAVLEQVPHVRAAHGGHDLVFSPTVWRDMTASVVTALEAFHRSYPQLLGPGLAVLTKSLRPRQSARYGAVVLRQLVSDSVLASESGAIRLPGHRLALDKNDHRLWQRLLPLLSGDNRFRPPQGRECASMVGAREIEVRRVLKTMAKRNGVVELARDRFFLRETLQEIAAIVEDIAANEEGGWFPAAALRNRLNNGRKVAIEVLEHFDRNGLTLREGDLRRIVPHRIAQFKQGVSGANAPKLRMEETRSRWSVRTSNPGGAVSQS